MFKEKIKALKSKISAKITAESSPEEIEEINNILAELDELDGQYDTVVDANNKYKDTIVRMVTSEGSSEAPKDEESGAKGMTIEEAVASVQGGK